MTQGQWMVKSGGKKVQAPSMGLRISIPKFDNSVLIAEYSKTLIGRCMNPFKQEMKMLLFHLPKIWNVDERVVGADLGLGRFQFDFDQEEDIVEVMKKEPFHFDNWMLSVVRWEPVMEENYPSKITFWVRVIGVPLHFWAVPTFKSIGEALGEVRGDDDIDIDEGKVRVIIDAFKPLVFSVTAEFHSGDESTIALRYEKLHGFCRICSSLRHDQFHCPTVKKSTDEETEVQPPQPEQDPAMLSYKGAVESQGRELGVDGNGNNRRQGHQVPRNRDYKGKGIAFDNSKYEGNSKSGFKRSYRDQDGGYSRNLRQTGRFPPSEAPMRYAMDTRGLKNLNAQEMGQNLDEQQKLMLDAFRSGKSEETNKISASTARKALTFEGNISGTAMEGLGGTDVASGIEGASVGEEDPKAVEEKLLPDRHGADKQKDFNKEESEGEKIEEMEGLSEEIYSELTGDAALTETGEQDGSEHVGDEVFAEADFDMEEDDQLMETETQEVLIAAEGKERGGGNKKKQGKVNGAAMGGSLKKRLVQSVVSPRKKHSVKHGSKVGEKGALPPKKAPVKPVPDQN